MDRASRWLLALKRHAGSFPRRPPRVLHAEPIQRAGRHQVAHGCLARRGGVRQEAARERYVGEADVLQALEAGDAGEEAGQGGIGARGIVVLPGAPQPRVLSFYCAPLCRLR